MNVTPINREKITRMYDAIKQYDLLSVNLDMFWFGYYYIC